MRRRLILAGEITLAIGLVVCLVLGLTLLHRQKQTVAGYISDVAEYTTQNDNKSPEPDSGKDIVMAGSEEADGTAEQDNEEPVIEPFDIGADFEALKAVNNEVVAWVTIPDTLINYPVVQGSNNTKYLSLGWNGTYVSGGAAFMDAREDIATADNYIIYGHNMGSSSDILFSRLKDYLDPDFYLAHPTIYISFVDDPIGQTQIYGGATQPEGQYAFDVIAVCTVNGHSDEDISSFYWYDSEYADGYSQLLTRRSEYDYIETESVEKYITLSTCAQNGTGRSTRLLIIGALRTDTLQTEDNVGSDTPAIRSPLPAYAKG